jgi:acyl phosphate:glycerol-3-phosphate acyltransferase
MQVYLLTVAIGYLLGSIPSGYLLVKAFQGQDIRKTGSGNIGATNVARTSTRLGVATLLLDALKGLLAVSVVLYWITPPPPSRTTLAVVAALSAVLGHIFPVWLRFRGGKGVATGLGSFVLLAPKSILVMLVMFIAIIFVFRYVSLGSIIVVALFPLLAWLLDEYKDAPVSLALMALSSILIIAKHHQNIRRLRARTEPRFGVRRG